MLSQKQNFSGLQFVFAFATKCLIFVCMNLALQAQSEAQNAKRDPQVVDVVNLKSRKQIRGIVLNPHGTDDVRMAVSREWLRKSDRELYSVADSQSAQVEQESVKQFSARLENWKVVATSPALNFFIENELERVKKIIDTPQDKDEKTESQFLIVSFKRSAIATATMATPVARNAATWGWSEGIEKIETKGLNELMRELKNRNVDPSKPSPDLSERFALQFEDDEKWRVRKAIVSSGLGQSIEFQGSGDAMFQTGSDEKPDMAALMTQMMQSQVNAMLQDLTGNGLQTPTRGSSEELPTWVKAACKKAEVLNSEYFRATHIAMDLLGETALVESAFYAKDANGKWKIVWRYTAEEIVSQQKAVVIKRVTQDPQIEQLRENLKGLGAIESMDKDLS